MTATIHSDVVRSSADATSQLLSPLLQASLWINADQTDPNAEGLTQFGFCGTCHKRSTVGCSAMSFGTGY